MESPLRRSYTSYNIERRIPADIIAAARARPPVCPSVAAVPFSGHSLTALTGRCTAMGVALLKLLPLLCRSGNASLEINFFCP